MTYREAREMAARLLADAGVENQQAESWFLMEAALGMSRSDYLLCQMEELPKDGEKAYFSLTEKRCRRIPLQHLTGEQEFMGLSFRVSEDVLIPRQDTETLVEEAIRILRDENPENRETRLRSDAPVKDGIGTQECERAKAVSVLDLCTGSGCIAVSIARYCPEVFVTASDISAKALAVAKENAALNGARVQFVESDLFSSVEGRFDMIVSNPPYIPTAVIDTLMPEVRDHEPKMALDGKADGLYFYHTIIEQAEKHLNSGGWLLFEIGYDQGEAVSERMRACGFEEIQVIRDLAGLDRVVRGRRKIDV